ncbi:MAG TPA: hypothetical protein VFZ32_09255 [Micromonosporaceae bacterium]
MLQGARRVWSDVLARRHIEAYVVAGTAFTIAVLSLLTDVVKDEVRWAAVLAGVGILVFGMTLPPREITDLDAHLHDRSRFDETPLYKRLVNAHEVCVFAPSAANLLSANHCDIMRRTVLARPDGALRVVVLDPDNDNAVLHAERYLDDTVDFPGQRLRESLATTLRQLATMSRWQVPGAVSWRLADVNPGFSLVGIDMNTPSGVVIVEFHGAHNVAVAGRMHMEITRKKSERWYVYWTGQFEALWAESRMTEAQPSVPTQRDPKAVNG